MTAVQLPARFVGSLRNLGGIVFDANGFANVASISTQQQALLDLHGCTTGGTAPANVYAADTAWQAPTLAGTWTQLAGGAPVNYRRDQQQFVHLRGSLAVPASSSALLFNLPAGYRPAADEPILGVVGSTPTVVTVKATGDVVVPTGLTAGATLSLGGINFRAEQ